MKIAMGLKYTPEFKQLARATPGLIRKLADAYKKSSETDCIRHGTVSAKKVRCNGDFHDSTWIVEAGGKKFFAKVVPQEWAPGHQADTQFEALVQLAEIAKQYECIKVVEPALALKTENGSVLLTKYYRMGKNSHRCDMPDALAEKFYEFMKAAEGQGIGDLLLNHYWNPLKPDRVLVFDPYRK